MNPLSIVKMARQGAMRKVLGISDQLKGIPSILLSNIDYAPVLLKGIAALKRDRAPFGPIPEFTPDLEPLSPKFDLEAERDELLARARYLIKEVAVDDPELLINKMPSPIGRFYQGEWAIYACSNTVAALSHLMRLYPEHTRDFEDPMRRIIQLMLTPTISWYDTIAYNEEALMTLDGNKSHMTYLSILAWAIGKYRRVSSDTRFDHSWRMVIETLVRRMKRAKYMNLPSFPNGIVFLPDMMFTLLALKEYGDLHNHEYDQLIREWMLLQKQHNIDPTTGLLVSNYYRNGKRGRPSGAYSGLSTSCLCVIDPDFGLEQYRLLKRNFLRRGKYVAIREYLDRDPEMSFDIDAGPVIMGISPSGTAFALGAATLLGDSDTRASMLRTAELAGHTVRKGDTLHYHLADIMLTGEAITLAMRTWLP